VRTLCLQSAFVCAYQSLKSSNNGEFPRSLLSIKQWFYNLVKTLLRRFRWGFLLAGFAALIMAGASWMLETSDTYWIWHRYYDKLLLSLLSLLFLCILRLTFFALLKWLQFLARYNIHIIFLLPLLKSKYC
jgi:hypothetical protein